MARTRKPTAAKPRKPKRKPRAKRPANRPTVRTPAVRRAVLAALRKGHPVKTAARLAGIAPSTLFLWAHDEPDFSDRIEAAKSKALAVLHNVVWKGAKESPALALEVLARRAPEDYGRVDRSKLTITDERPSGDEMDLSKLTEAELEWLDAITRKARPTPAEGTG